MGQDLQTPQLDHVVDANNMIGLADQFQVIDVTGGGDSKLFLEARDRFWREMGAFPDMLTNRPPVTVEQAS